MAGQVDYDALAQQSGGAPAAVDYDALAKQHGATSGGSSKDPGFAHGVWETTVGPLVDSFKNAMKQASPTNFHEAMDAVKNSFSKSDLMGPGGAMISGIVKQAYEQGQKAVQSHFNGMVQAVRGDTLGAIASGVESIGHLGAAALPVVGPMAAKAGEDIGTGKPFEGLGEAAGTIGTVLAGGMKPRSVPISPKMAALNPAEADAVQAGIANGVPVDAATATGNRFVQGTQALADRTIGGSIVASNAQKQAAGAMKEWGGRLAEDVHPTAQVPESAGRSVAAGGDKLISNLKQDADAAYDNFRTAANDPKNVKTVQTGTRTETSPIVDAQGNAATRTVPVTKDIAMPVDMTGIKSDLAPILKDMDAWMEPAKRNAMAGYQAIKSIVNGEDFIPADQAEKGLAGLKSLARGAEPDMANVSQGLGKLSTGKLQNAIDTAVGQADPKALRALQAGRAIHAEKMGAAEVLGNLRDEPVQLFNQATWKQDAGIDRLRAVAKLVPDEMPKLGRAYIENLMTKATSEGGFGHGQAIWSQWQNLGPQTKQVLFGNAGQIKELDNFFNLARKMAENPNPSGTAYVASIGAQGALLFTHPTLGIPMQIGGAALSKLLRSPSAIKTITDGMRVPVTGGAAATTAAGRLLSLAGPDAIPQPAQ